MTHPTPEAVERAVRHFRELEMPRSVMLELVESILTDHYTVVWAITKLMAQDWQSMETARKDGKRILGWTKSWAEPFVVKWSPQRPFPCWTVDSGAVVDEEPTHLMPLPLPPKEKP